MGSQVTNFCQELLDMAKKRYGAPVPGTRSGFPNMVSKLEDVFKIIEEILENRVFVHTEETLDQDHEVIYEEAVEEPNCYSESTTQSLSQEWESLQIGNKKYSLELMKNVVA